MRKYPPGIRRERGDHAMPPGVWIIWLGEPHAEGSARLGRSIRKDDHLVHRFFPETGEWPQDIKGWVKGVRWLLELHQGHEARVDRCTMTETEHVTEL